MTRYAKFIDEKHIEEAPHTKGSLFNYNDESNAAMLLANGYKPLADYPAVPAEMRQPVIRYRELAGCIEPYYEESYIAPPEPTYAEQRAAEYPLIGDQLDAILKGFMVIRDSGIELHPETNDLIEYWLSVKAKYPKDSQGGSNGI